MIKKTARFNTRIPLDLFKLIEILDPVVLQPVMGGYMILAAWGDEASDPLVVNEQNN